MNISTHDRDQVGDTTTTAAVATAYVAMCRKGEFSAAIDRFFSHNHIRLEAFDMAGPAVEIRGLQAVKENMTRFTDESKIHSAEISEPLISEHCFAARFAIDTTFLAISKRATVTKISLYNVDGGKIVREEVFYLEPPPTTGLIRQAR